ncbi:tetratricopeptide repeat protein [Legionella israelensis]|uniref:Tetratricopeptide repeat protein n=1 Tax=Legionella israelensis TaxID=454 RepID=A0AAX1EFT2_9GAMM|nr:tetratricopeptide repeat protein [Legionella israelensis]QBR83980.1 tetratricopeptide repeat protein [Legionella israelensis]
MNKSVEQTLERYLCFLQQDPENTNLLLDIIECYVKIKNYTQALYYCEQIRKSKPFLALLTEGNIYFKQKKYHMAYRLYKDAFKLEDNFSIRYHLSLTFFHLQKLDEALNILTPLIQEHHTEALVLAARIFYQNKQPAAALLHLDEILTKNSRNADALAFKAFILFEQEQMDKAGELAEQALRHNPYLYEAKLVKLLLHQNLSHEQLNDVHFLLGMHPHEPRLWFMQGLIFFSQFKIKEAEHSLQQAINLYPEYYDAHISLYWCQLLQDKNKDAFVSCQKAIEIMPQAAEGWGALALFHALQDKFDMANHYLKKSQQLLASNLMAEMAELIILKKHNPLLAQKKFNELFANDIHNYKKIFEYLLSKAPQVH